ncbi:hypothetical protein ACFV16_04090 [Streptomyces massasporeus]|uniref:hypothetical protein n=1 Tax=Streptomyces massasporeus TaxID=67324 RepID=UPI00369274A1
MDMFELMEWLSERGVTTVFKVDGERMLERRAAWMVIVSGGPLGKDSFFRADLATPDACLDALLAHLEDKGLSPFA